MLPFTKKRRRNCSVSLTGQPNKVQQNHQNWKKKRTVLHTAILSATLGVNICIKNIHNAQQSRVAQQGSGVKPACNNVTPKRRSSKTQDSTLSQIYRDYLQEEDNEKNVYKSTTISQPLTLVVLYVRINNSHGCLGF